MEKAPFGESRIFLRLQTLIIALSIIGHVQYIVE